MIEDVGKVTAEGTWVNLTMLAVAVAAAWRVSSIAAGMRNSIRSTDKRVVRLEQKALTVDRFRIWRAELATEVKRSDCEFSVPQLPPRDEVESAEKDSDAD